MISGTEERSDMYRKMASSDIDKTRKTVTESKESVSIKSMPEMSTDRVHVGMNNNDMGVLEDQVEAVIQFELETNEEKHTNIPTLCRVEQISKNLNSAEHCQLENNGTSKENGNAVGHTIDGNRKHKIDKYTTNGNTGIQDTNALDVDHFDINKDIEHFSTQVCYTSEGTVWNVSEKHDYNLHAKVHGPDVIKKNSDKTVKERHENQEIKQQQEKLNKAQNDYAVDHHDKVNHIAEIDAKGVREKCGNLDRHIKRLTFDERESGMGCHFGDYSGIYSEHALGLERHQLQPLLEDMVSGDDKNNMSCVVRKPVLEV